MIKVRIKKLTHDAVVPAKAYDDDFAFDLVAVSCVEIAPNVYKYGLGIALQMECDENDCALGFTIRPRSSIWKTGMILSNSIGTVDKGYTGEISVVMYHVLPTMPRYQVGDRVAQIHFDISPKMEFQEVEFLKETERGDKGYGSTGIK